MTTIDSRSETHHVVGRPAHDTPLLRQLRVEWALWQHPAPAAATSSVPFGAQRAAS